MSVNSGWMPEYDYNDRPISLSSVFAKLFDLILLMPTSMGQLREHTVNLRLSVCGYLSLR